MPTPEGMLPAGAGAGAGEAEEEAEGGRGRGSGHREVFRLARGCVTTFLSRSFRKLGREGGHLRWGTGEPGPAPAAGSGESEPIGLGGERGVAVGGRAPVCPPRWGDVPRCDRRGGGTCPGCARCILNRRRFSSGRALLWVFSCRRAVLTDRRAALTDASALGCDSVGAKGEGEPAMSRPASGARWRESPALAFRGPEGVWRGRAGTPRRPRAGRCPGDAPGRARGARHSHRARGARGDHPRHP